MKKQNMKPVLILLFGILFQYSLVGQDIIAEENFSYDGITTLAVKGKFAEVELIGHSNSQLDFKGKITGNSGKRDYQILHEKDGNTLSVWIESSGRNSWNSGNLKGSLRFKVPQNINIDIDNSSGKVIAEDISGDRIRLEASSGAIIASNLKGETRIETSSGRIELKGLEGNLRSESSSGRQVLEDVMGDIDSETSSGRIVLEGTTGSLELRTSSGGIEGEDVTIKNYADFVTSSGSINMELLNDMDDFSFDMRSNSGSIYIDRERIGKKYYYKNGNLRLNARTSSGSQKFYSRNKSN